MYKVTVPIMNFTLQRSDRDAIVKELKKFDAERVLLALQPYLLEKEVREREFKMLSENVDYLKDKGFEVGVWFWSFMIPDKNSYQKMISLDGKTIETEVCPLDKKFQKFAVDYIENVAMTNPDMIQFDDDFRFSLLAAEPACLCPNHMERIHKKVGDTLEFDKLSEKILLGEDNKYRRGWIETNGEALIEFSKIMRRTVDKVNPKIRMGVCSCTSSWDIDGGVTNEIDRILAGKNKPFRRLIMAPYWAVNREWGNKLQNVIEFERMESTWCDKKTEIMAEGDVYPRPRTNCPASYLEIFDTALRADGSFDGILKYGIDYYSSAKYEKGYAKSHLKNKQLYDTIEKTFSDKETCGVRVYENPNKIKGSCFDKKGIMNGLFFAPSAYVLSENSIPTTYSGKGVFNMALGDNIKIVPEKAMKQGVIIDAKAARILIESGVDVGCKFKDNKPTIKSKTEYFINQKEYVNCNAEVYDVALCDRAVVLSEFYEEQECLKNSYTASYIYTNANGFKFLVYAFDFESQKRSCYCSYARSRQIADGIKNLSEEVLPAYSYGNPDLYIMAKKDEGSMTVGLWNCFADIVYDGIIELDKEYSNISFINCQGELRGDKVCIDEIPSFGFAGFEVS